MQIISIISILLICLLILMNYQDSFIVYVFSEQFSLHLNIPAKYFTVNLAIYTAVIFMLGILSTIFFIAPLYFSLKNKFEAYKRELERGSISNTNGEARIKVLENKITVLEKALNEALKKDRN